MKEKIQKILNTHKILSYICKTKIEDDNLIIEFIKHINLPTYTFEISINHDKTIISVGKGTEYKNYPISSEKGEEEFLFKIKGICQFIEDITIDYINKHNSYTNFIKIIEDILIQSKTNYEILSDEKVINIHTARGNVFLIIPDEGVIGTLRILNNEGDLLENKEYLLIFDEFKILKSIMNHINKNIQIDIKEI